MRLIPWAGEPPGRAERLRTRAETDAVVAEQTELAGEIDAAANYLEYKAHINGFSRQLQAGFLRRHTGE